LALNQMRRRRKKRERKRRSHPLKYRNVVELFG
jgi:hypothetical protein